MPLPIAEKPCSLFKNTDDCVFYYFLTISLPKSRHNSKWGLYTCCLSFKVSERVCSHDPINYCHVLVSGGGTDVEVVGDLQGICICTTLFPKWIREKSSLFAYHKIDLPKEKEKFGNSGRQPLMRISEKVDILGYLDLSFACRPLPATRVARVRALAQSKA